MNETATVDPQPTRPRARVKTLQRIADGVSGAVSTLDRLSTAYQADRLHLIEQLGELLIEEARAQRARQGG